VLEASVISPVLGLPANGATGQALSLMLSWQPVTNATGYNVQVSTSSSFATLFIQDSTLTSASKTIGGLSGGVTYYWRVRAETAGEKSAWSTVWSFTTSAVTLQAPMLLSPFNASTNQPVTCLLSWSAVTNATGYHVQVSTNSAFTVIFSQDSTLTADSMKLGGLASGTTYYWRVRARNAGGAGYWSGTWSFITTSSALGTPTLFAPLNGATAQVLPLALTWSTVTNATSYRVQVSSDSTFSTVKVDDSTLVSASKTVDSLTRGVKFFWRVRAKNATVVSSWTTPWNFTTAQSSIPAVPTLVSPSNGAPGQPQILTLIWSPVGGDSTYRVQLSTSSTFATLAVDDSTLTAANRAVGTLAPGTTYYWRVRAKNAFGSSAWTGVWSFTTSTAPLPSPVLNSPANGAAGLNPVALQLSWSVVTNATSYRIQVSSDSAFSSVAVDDSALASPLKTLDSLPRGVKFYWRVRAKNTAGVSVWASPWNFTTVAPPIPSVPTLVSPVNSSVNQSRRPTLVWSTVSGAATYHVQVSLDSSFSIVLIKDSTLTTASKTIDSLPYGVKVFWRVRAKNAIGTSGWSSAWSFTTIAAAASPWVTKTPMPTAKIYMGIAVLNNKIYLIGGYNGTSYIATVEMYDPSIDKWSTMPDMPMSRAPAAAVYNNKIYVIGGGDIGTVQEYDPGANTWIDKTPMPTVRGPAVTMIGSIIYAIGGYNSITGSLGTNESYDPSTDTWSSLADMTARNSTPVAAAGGKVYAFGGEYWPSTPLNLVEEYDPLGNAWATKTVLPTARTRAAAVTVNRKIYVIGGTDDVIDLAKVDLYDPSSDTWTAKTAMPTARSGSGIAFVNGKIYVFGGSSSSNPHLTTVEEYDPLLDP
jgi:N-acetylneuraminic acid mutarotase